VPRGYGLLPMIALSRIRDLDIAPPGIPGRPLYLSAASGLVRVNARIYVVADDELHLGVFRLGDSSPGHVIRLFEGALPDSKIERKKRKPDLEALAFLPPDEKFPHGALLALGSGSKRNRRLGALLRLNAGGGVQGVPEVVDLSPVFAPLAEEFHALNIEGAVVSGNELRLFQRGNRRHHENAIIRFSLSAFLGALDPTETATAKPLATHRIDLGQVNGIPFSFTDAAALPGGDMVFTAVAEDTDNSFDDGPCVAAAIGVASGDGGLRWLRPLDHPYKVEGVDARVDGRVTRLMLVTDADDAEVPAALFSAAIES
jgi:hypothetical protein